MHTLNPPSGQSSPRAIFCSNSKPRSREEREPAQDRQRIFKLKRNASVGALGQLGGEGHQKLRNRLISYGITESIVDELLEQPNIISYSRGSFIFLEGAPSDLLFWVSSGIVDIICPGVDGEQVLARVLGPGEFFGFVEGKDHKGRSVQAFQARARTNVQVGLLIREHVCKLLTRQEPALLLRILQEVVAAWSSLTLRHTQLIGKNYGSRFEMVLAELAAKFGVKEARGTLLVPEFGHSDFAEMIGCSRPMVSRLIAEMISAGSLAQNGKHYIIIDDSALNNGKRTSA